MRNAEELSGKEQSASPLEQSQGGSNASKASQAAAEEENKGRPAAAPPLTGNAEGAKADGA